MLQNEFWNENYVRKEEIVHTHLQRNIIDMTSQGYTVGSIMIMSNLSLAIEENVESHWSLIHHFKNPGTELI